MNFENIPSKNLVQVYDLLHIPIETKNMDRRELEVFFTLFTRYYKCFFDDVSSIPENMLKDISGERTQELYSLADSYSSLLYLNDLFLQGKLPETFTHYGALEDDGSDFVKLLRAMTRRGMYTCDSQETKVMTGEYANQFYEIKQTNYITSVVPLSYINLYADKILTEMKDCIVVIHSSNEVIMYTFEKMIDIIYDNSIKRDVEYLPKFMRPYFYKERIPLTIQRSDKDKKRLAKRKWKVVTGIPLKTSKRSVKNSFLQFLPPQVKDQCNNELFLEMTIINFNVKKLGKIIDQIPYDLNRLIV